MTSSGNFNETTWKALISHTWAAYPKEFKQDFSLRSEHVLFCDPHNKQDLRHERPDFSIATNPKYWKRHYIVEAKLVLNVDEIKACLDKKHYLGRYEDTLKDEYLRTGIPYEQSGMVFIGRDLLDGSGMASYLNQALRGRVSVIYNFPQFASWLFNHFAYWAKENNLDKREITSVLYALEQEVSILFPERKVLADEQYRSLPPSRRR